MKYILMMNTMTAGATLRPGWSQQDFGAHIAHMMQLGKDLRESGELVMAEGLTVPDEAKLVRASDEGERRGGGCAAEFGNK